METNAQPELARTLGKYTLIEKLGDGAGGQVHRGLDVESSRAVVVRILGEGIPWNAQIEEILFRECRSVAGLQHPGIAAVYEVGKDGPSPFIVTEFLGGYNLESLIAQKTAIPVEAKLSIIVRVAEGLAYAHSKGVLHRGLGPAKIHLTADGEVKIRDFGIAHALAKNFPDPDARHGAPVYLSPEQVRHKEDDERSEIFSAGTVFYELITYKHPFHDPNVHKALDNILQDTEIPAFEQFPHEPPGIWPILKTCLARDPKERYKSMGEVWGAFTELLKDIEDDTRFMLSELHASLVPLRRAASRAGASDSTVRLLQDVQKTLSSDEFADYATLDRLMNGIVEQQAAIQEAAGTPQTLEAEHLRFFSKVSGISGEADQGVAPSATARMADDASTRKQPVVTILATGLPEPSAQSADTPKAPQTADLSSSENNAPSPLNGPTAISPIPPAPEIPQAEWAEEAMTAAIPAANAVPPAEQALQDSIAAQDTEEVQESVSVKSFPWFPKLTYRSAAALLSILLIAAAVHIFFEKGAAESLSSAWSIGMLNPQMPSQSPGQPAASHKAAKNSEGNMQSGTSTRNKTASILLQEARALAAMNRTEESKVLLRRVLEIDPSSAEAVDALGEAVEGAGADRDSPADPALQKRLVKVSSMIQSGRLQPAKTELDKLRRAYPDSPEIQALHKQWQTRRSREAETRARLEEEQKAAQRRKQKEDEWNRKATEYFSHGKYSEASSTLKLWMAEDPHNSRASELDARIQEIQRGLKAYASAMSENRYQDALNALGGAERLNPADSSLAELRRQAETRKAAAKATLTIHRLGAKGNLLLDGRPIGNDGEIAGENIAIGSHTLTIEDAGSPVVIRNQEFLENQRVVLAYDLSKQVLRPMTEMDRELLLRRKAMEAVHNFTLEHSHGLFRGSCAGVLSISYSDVIYRPNSGTHGFRMPFKLLDIKGTGKSVDLIFSSDKQQYQSFKFADAQTAGKFRQTWNELKALGP